MSVFQTAFGRYELVEVLGRGGFATVYRARDPLLRREVALKTLLPHLCEDEGVRARFIAEAQRIAQLHHPNIVTVFEVGEVDRSPYFTMELIEGRTLASAISPGQHEDPERVVALMQSLCSAVDYLHGARLIHRDIKPANIMVENEGRIVLMDFGISRSLDDSSFTQTGISIGTPKAMAPEQIQGKVVGPAADVYALGILAYQLLSGRAPFEGEVSRILHAHAYEPPPDLHLLRPGLPDHIYNAIHAALAKDPAQRPASAGLFAAALAGQVAIAPPTTDAWLRPPASQASGEGEPERTPTPPDAPTTVMRNMQGKQAPVVEPIAPALPRTTPATGVSRRALLVSGGAAAIALGLGGVLFAKSRSGGTPTVVPATLVANVNPTGSATPVASASPAGSVTPAVVVPPTPQPAGSPSATPVPLTPVAPTAAPTPAPPVVPASDVSTVAGSGREGFADGPALQAQFSYPSGVTRGKNGVLYVTDMGSNRIRTVTPGGAVTTLAGSGEPLSRDGIGSAAAFNQPNDIAIDAQGTLYVADSGNNQIRRITPNGAVTTLAGSGAPGATDGAGAAAQFSYPAAIAIDAAGTLYVADFLNNRVRKVTADGTVTTLAGSTRGYVDGLGKAAQFAEPGGLAVDAAGNVYVSDSGNNRIRRITPAGMVSTIAGDSSSGLENGPGKVARFNSPAGLAVDGSSVYVADSVNNAIRIINADGYVSVLAGNQDGGYTDGPGAEARFSQPSALSLDDAGNLYVADSKNGRIRRIAIKQTRP